MFSVSDDFSFFRFFFFSFFLSFPCLRYICACCGWADCESAVRSFFVVVVLAGLSVYMHLCLGFVLLLDPRVRYRRLGVLFWVFVSCSISLMGLMKDGLTGGFGAHFGTWLVLCFFTFRDPGSASLLGGCQCLFSFCCWVTRVKAYVCLVVGGYMRALMGVCGFGVCICGCQGFVGGLCFGRLLAGVLRS